MYIEPNTDIRLLNNIRINSNYIDTIYFNNRTEQATYFISKTKYNLANYSFQRHTTNAIKVGIKSDLLYDCNYMMFKNTNFGDKWFYAFITEVEYINNNASIVYYQIDDMQTWFMDTKDLPYMVEREHSVDDVIFANHVPEDFSFSDYVATRTFPNILGNNNLMAILLVTEIPNEESPTGWSPLSATVHENIVDTCFYIPFAIDFIGDDNKISEFIRPYESAGKADSILGIYIVPTYVLRGKTFKYGEPLDYYAARNITNFNVNVNCKPTNLHGYYPHNKKLFNSPYCVIELTNNMGSSQLYSPEDCRFAGDDDTLLFSVNASYMQTGEIWCNPLVYKETTALNQAVVISNYTQGILNYDTFKNWWASERIGFYMSTVPNLAYFGLGALNFANNYYKASSLSGATRAAYAQSQTLSRFGTSVIDAGVEAGESVYKEIGKVLQAQVLPPTTIGHISQNAMLTRKNKMNFDVKLYTLKEDVAKTVDTYFDMFGYKTMELKHPNYNSRPHWNYIKTQGATVVGNIPNEAINSISIILNNGIRFWKNGDEVGNYELDNTVQGGD